MKIYLDANIYVDYLLGQKSEELAAEAFRRCIGCSFKIVSSPTVVEEAILACKGNTILMQNLWDSLKKAGKLSIVQKDAATVQEAILLNEKTGKKYGRNDFIHAILAAEHADAFVTRDLKFMPSAREIVHAETLEEFLSSL